MAGCGLKVSEACGLKWADIDLGQGWLRIAYAAGTKKRQVEFPPAIRSLLAAGVARCAGAQYVFGGARRDAHLSSRTVTPIPTAALPLQAFEMPVACAEPPIAFAVAIKTRLTDRFPGERAAAARVVRCSSP